MCPWSALGDRGDTGEFCWSHPRTNQELGGPCPQPCNNVTQAGLLPSHPPLWREPSRHHAVFILTGLRGLWGGYSHI